MSSGAIGALASEETGASVDPTPPSSDSSCATLPARLGSNRAVERVPLLPSRIPVQLSLERRLVLNRMQDIDETSTGGSPSTTYVTSASHAATMPLGVCSNRKRELFSTLRCRTHLVSAARLTGRTPGLHARSPRHRSVQHGSAAMPKPPATGDLASALAP